MSSKGFCDEKFILVKEAFEQNFDAYGDVGSSVAVYRHGERLVDLWGGYTAADADAPWQKDTLVNIWSTTKAITATCFAMAVDRGVFTYADRVADYWPEFRAAGKGDVTIAMLLSHQAGLCGFPEPVTYDDIYDIERAANMLAAATPLWKPGTASGYHAITIGALASELFKRAEGRSLRQFADQELRGGLGLDMYIGAPETEWPRVSDLINPASTGEPPVMPELTAVQVAALTNPMMIPTTPNNPAWRTAEIPSANGHATARALAQLHSALASDCKINGRSVASKDTIQKATSVQIEGVDLVLAVEARWACGFLRNTNGLYGPNDDSFGHSGWGGSFAFGDPTAGLGVAYTMNKMGTQMVDDPRNMALVNAVYNSLENE